jgi:hypothetical protein
MTRPNSNCAPPEYKVKALPPEPACLLYSYCIVVLRRKACPGEDRIPLVTHIMVSLLTRI